MRLISLLNHYQHFPGFVYERARHCAPSQTIEISVRPRRGSRPVCDQWPGSWAYEKRDIPYGLRIVECFKPFLREMLARTLSRKTLRQHRDNIWVLGGEVIRRVQMDNDLRRQGPKELPGGLPACQRNRSSPIPCRATARISLGLS